MPPTTNVEAGQTSVKHLDCIAVQARIQRILAHYKETIDPAKASRPAKTVMMSDILVAIIERRQVAAGAAATAPSDGATPPAGTSPVVTDRTGTAAPAAGSPTDGAPSPTDSGAALGPTSAVWPTSFTDPPGAPEPKSGTWATDRKGGNTAAKTPSAPSAVRPATQEAVASQATARTPSSPGSLPADPDAADFAKLEALGMSRELAEMVLTRLDESLAELPL